MCEITTNTNTFRTPIFMPVGTKASVKGLSPEDIKEVSSGIILANTYHLMLTPGIDVIKKHKGVKQFMNWNGSLLTDSGGFQVFSLANKKDITDSGVKFKNFKNGDEIFLSPEDSINLQYHLDSDIMMAFDECVSLPCDDAYMEKSIKRTTDWAKRCLQEHKKLKSNQAIFGIFQGGLNKDLRLKSLNEINSLPFDGIAIGGLSVGETEKEMYEMLEFLRPHLPNDKPRYLMGVGTPRDFLKGILEGIDMMDCVLPTRNARHGQIFTTDGKVNIKNEKYKLDTSPIDVLNLKTKDYSKSYLRHLVKENEMFGSTLASIQNLGYMKYLTEEAQKAILEDRFPEFYEKITKIYKS